MRVNKVKNLLSHEVSTALEFLAVENSTPKYITTASFCKNNSEMVYSYDFKAFLWVQKI